MGNTPTPASQWKNKIQVDGTDLELPSENVARIKQISPQAFLGSGLIPDPLTAIISQAINTKKGMPPQVVDKIAEDPKQLAAAMELFDRVLVYVAIEPQIIMPPTCEVCDEYYNVDERHSDTSHENYHAYIEGDRDPDTLYADQVDMDDKMFIFNFCLGGTRSLETFRQEQQASMDAVSNGQVVRGAPKRPARRP